MKRRIFKISKEQLEELYIGKNLSSIKIGKIFGFESSTVLRLINKYGIKKIRNSKVRCECLACKFVFYIYPAWIRRGSGKYCSTKCAMNHVPRRKRGKYLIHKTNPTWFKKGEIRKKLELPEDLIKKLYIEDKMTTVIIAKIFNTNDGVITKRLKDMGVDTTKRRRYSSQHRILAKGGRLVSSYSEKFIADWLFENNLNYTYDKCLPNSKLKFDFYLPSLNLYIEYFGLIGKDFYDKKTERKIEFYKNNNLNLMSIFPKDNITEKLNELLINVKV
jgi:hypothetical protein